MLQACQTSTATFFRAPMLADIARVVHGFSTRGPKDLETSPNANDGFLDALGLAGWEIARLKQTHSSVVRRVPWCVDDEFPEGDAAYTDSRGLVLEVRTADCVPVLVAERRGRAVGIAHAGWRGTCRGIVGKLVTAMAADLGVAGADLVAGIGPHIGVCCLEVGDEVLRQFADATVFERRQRWEKTHLNLAEANRKQLLAAGVKPEMIETSRLCTHCRDDLFHSYRRDGNAAGRMYAIIGLKP